MCVYFFEGDGEGRGVSVVTIFTLWKIFKRESKLSPAPPRPGMKRSGWHPPPAGLPRGSLRQACVSRLQGVTVDPGDLRG